MVQSCLPLSSTTSLAGSPASLASRTSLLDIRFAYQPAAKRAQRKSQRGRTSSVGTSDAIPSAAAPP
jgi:hypothetical protein